MANFNTVAETINRVSRGDFANEIDLKLQEIVEYLQDNPEHKCEIEVKLVMQNTRGIIDINPTYKTKYPVKRFNPSIFYGGNGSLHTSDPQQDDLFADNSPQTVPDGNVTNINN